MRRPAPDDMGDMTRGAADEPLVAVVMPVYNGADSLERSIECVTAQTHRNWVLAISDNLSDDDSLEIARRHARADERITVYEGDSFVPMLANWNRAMSHVPPEARYVKQLNADDMMLPACIEQMVALAERHPSVSVVGAYRKEGKLIAAVDLAVDQQVVPGAEFVRRALLGGLDYVGAPGSVLFRAVPSMPAGEFYDPGVWPPDKPVAFPRWSVDKEPIYDLLETGDFGFVHQLLTYEPDDQGGQTSFTLRIRAQIPGDLQLLLSRGPRFLAREEFRRAVDTAVWSYSWLLAKQTLKLRPWRDRDFRAYHHAATEALAAELRDAGFRSAARRLDLWTGLYAAGGPLSGARFAEPRALRRA